ncbi:MAG: formyltransferase family protein [Campylobacterota bacterium]|nr:formyltransferase family protein [Campylobacterota bacterium]
MIPRRLPKVAILFSGAGSNMAYILEHLHHKELDVVIALTNNPKAKGIAIAKSYKIPHTVIEHKDYESRELYDTILVRELQAYQPDLTVLAGFMRILTPIFTDTVKAINLHPSLLPRHKGLKAIERSYEDEFHSGGASVHWVSSELDGGEVITQREVTKGDLSFEEYEHEVKTIEKITLADGIKKVLNSDVL